MKKNSDGSVLNQQFEALRKVSAPIFDNINPYYIRHSAKKEPYKRGADFGLDYKMIDKYNKKERNK
jgi:hypothetical protein